MPKQTTLKLFKDPLPIPTTVFPAALPNSTAVIEMKPSTTTLHSDLPPTNIWGYDGTFPGPTIEVNRWQRVHVRWKNKLKTSPVGHTAAGLPMTVVTSPDDTQSEAGTSTTDPARIQDVSDIPPFTVVHLHGAKTHPDSDGWTENGVLIDQALFYTYENTDRATMFWYHDHAMGITRFNVYAGLAGLYIVRDPEELGLHLPNGSFEITMILQDRNIETDNDGHLTGKLVHKVEDGIMEFFGPFNLVNGKISPFLNVKRKFYRFRIANGCNARTYKLKLLLDDAQNTPFTTPIFNQIGSDGGLFKTKVQLPNNELILAPGERADIIADFTGINLKGKKLNWVNVAAAPFDGSDVIFSNPKTLDNDQNIINSLRQKNACVMQFRVANTSSVEINFSMPEVLSDSFVRTTHATLLMNHEHRVVALVEEEREKKDSTGNPIPDPANPGSNLKEPMLMLRELEETEMGETIPPGEFKLTAPDLSGMTTNMITYKSVASMFYDPITFMMRYGNTEVWKIINLTGDTHPFHVHLVQFQALGRQTITGGIAESGDTNAVGAMLFNIHFDQPKPDDNLLDSNEKGWKDTIRVNPGELMAIAMKFDGHNGRYMYHCHLLEHEDRELMRPFTVMPDAIMDAMNMGKDNHHHH